MYSIFWHGFKMSKQNCCHLGKILRKELFNTSFLLSIETHRNINDYERVHLKIKCSLLNKKEIIFIMLQK